MAATFKVGDRVIHSWDPTCRGRVQSVDSYGPNYFYYVKWDHAPGGGNYWDKDLRHTNVLDEVAEAVAD